MKKTNTQYFSHTRNRTITLTDGKVSLRVVQKAGMTYGEAELRAICEIECESIPNPYGAGYIDDRTNQIKVLHLLRDPETIRIMKERIYPSKDTLLDLSDRVTAFREWVDSPESEEEERRFQEDIMPCIRSLTGSPMDGLR